MPLSFSVGHDHRLHIAWDGVGIERDGPFDASVETTTPRTLYCFTLEGASPALVGAACDSRQEPVNPHMAAKELQAGRREIRCTPVYT